MIVTILKQPVGVVNLKCGPRVYGTVGSPLSSIDSQ